MPIFEDFVAEYGASIEKPLVEPGFLLYPFSRLDVRQPVRLEWIDDQPAV